MRRIACVGLLAALSLSTPALAQDYGGCQASAAEAQTTGFTVTLITDMVVSHGNRRIIYTAGEAVYLTTFPLGHDELSAVLKEQAAVSRREVWFVVNKDGDQRRQAFTLRSSGTVCNVVRVGRIH